MSCLCNQSLLLEGRVCATFIPSVCYSTCLANAQSVESPEQQVLVTAPVTPALPPWGHSVGEAYAK